MKLLLRRMVLVTAIIYLMSKTWEVFKETGCRSSKPKLEMLVRLNASLFKFPKNNTTK